MKFWFRRVVFCLVPLLCIAADWPVPKSIKCNSTGTFHCKNTGKFEDPFDSTCTKYFLCNQFEDETVEVELTCPENYFYDPVNELCSGEYKCICNEDTNYTTSIPTTTSSTLKTKTPVPYPDECEICSQCITTIRTKTTTSRNIWTTYPFETTSHVPKEYANTTTVNAETTTSETTVSSATTLQSEQSSSRSSSSKETTLETITTQQPSSTSSQSSSTQTSLTTESTTPKYCAHGGNFICTETGRFANPNDPSCNSYFYCYIWSNSTIGQYSYSCSIGLFNPTKGGCDVSYVCPCSEGTTIDTTSTTTKPPSSTSIQSSSPTQTISTTESTTVSSSTPKYCDRGGNFTCTETGRFANPNDPSCNSYFYCYVWSNSTVGQYSYSCSIGLFNPMKGACDISYVCPCSEGTTINTTSTTTKPPSSTSIQSSSPTQTISTTESTTVSSPTPKYCALGGNFTCTETGRFANPNDPSCNSYFYCYVWSNSTVGQYSYSCSIGLFNPMKGACDISYACPCSEGTTINTTSTTTKPPSSTSIQSSSPTQTISTTESTTVSSSTPKYCDRGGNFTCTETGRFANPNDPSCNSYFYCYVWSNSTVGQYSYSCSIGLFNPMKGACDISYVCPCSEGTTINTTSTTTKPPSSTNIQSSSLTQTISTTESTTVSSSTPKYCDRGGNFTCTETGRFANPNDPSCNSYFHCYVGSKSTVRQYSYSCSIGLFNPMKGACDISYVCPCSEGTTIDTTSTTTKPPSSTSIQSSSHTQTISTTESTTVSSPTPKYCALGGNFTCTETGRFANPNDPSCNSYFHCYVGSKSTVRQYSYSCSIGLFNPMKGACDISYICPCSEGTTIDTTSTTSKPPSSTSIQSSSTTQTISTTESTTVSSSTPKYCDRGGNFTCTETGRFANPNDPSCNSYFHCYVGSKSTVRQYSYSCSIGLFNPMKGACDISYVCPCSEGTTIDTTSTTTKPPSSTSIQSSSPTQTISTTESTTVSSSTPKYCDRGENFTCTETGRFANPNDLSCNSYFHCYVGSKSTVRQYSYSCSIGLFNPMKGACDMSYVCPCSEGTTINTTSTTTKPPSSTSIQSSSPTQTISTTESTTVSSTTPKYCARRGNFTCAKTGRFANPNDPQCISYFYCYVWGSGSVGQYLYSCSVGLFNPNKGACDRSYVCPCTVTYTNFAANIRSVPKSNHITNRSFWLP